MKPSSVSYFFSLNVKARIDGKFYTLILEMTTYQKNYSFQNFRRPTQLS